MSRAGRERRFIGRDEELGRLQSLLGSASTGVTRFALVSGAAGVGKSSLLNEFAARADARVLTGSCLSLGEYGVPFAPIIEILRSLESDPRSGELLPAGLGSLEPVLATPIAGPASRTQLFQAVLKLIARLVESSPAVVVIEDLHWADHSTRDLLWFLISNLHAERLLLVMSYRTDDVHRNHPLRPVLAELQRNPRLEQIEVAPFTTALAAEQIEQLTGAAPSGAYLDEVMLRTQGNPYFVEELVAADALDGRVLPASLRELLLVRVDVVSADVRRTLRILSLAEHQVSAETLAHVAARSVAEIREHVREAIDTRLLVTTSAGTEFAHALLREALQDDLLLGERAEYHAAFADALALELHDATSNRAGLVARLAHHREGAGDISGAIAAWGEAARAAEAIFAFAEAHHHLAQIIANWHLAPSAADRVGLRYADVVSRAAENAFMAGNPRSACELARQAIALIDDAVEPHTAGMLHERLARYVRDTAEHDQALGLAERAFVLVPADPPSADRARVLAGLAGQLLTHGRYAEARGFATQAVDMARLSGSILAEADALNTLGTLATVLDDVEHGIALLHEALTLAERCGDSHQQMRSYWNTMACLSDAGEWNRALIAFRDAKLQLPRLGQGHLLPELFANAADILLRLGRWDEAQATIDEAQFGFEADTRAPVLSELVVERGQFEKARQIIASWTDRNIFTDQEQQGWPLVHLAALETWEGRYDAARQAVDAALAVTADLDSPIATSSALAIGCRCEADAAEHARRRSNQADEQLATARATSLLEKIMAVLARPGPANGWKREVGALAGQCAAELARARGRPDVDAWATATKAWEAMEMPYHAAYTRFRYAEAVFASSDDRGHVGILLRDAHGVASSLGADPLRSLIEAFARRARIDIGLSGIERDRHGLTPREREVLANLGAGATNRQIAATLFISEKTASVHVSNIIRKLGVANRGEAAALAHREGLLA